MVDIIVTEAGLAEIVNAENTGTAPVVLSAVGFGTGQYTVTAKQTALQAEFKRIEAVKGISIGDNIININLTDESDDSYKVYEIGIFTDSGTLFAVCSQNTPLLEKAAISKVALAIDFALTNVNPESITFGDANFLLNSATTEQQGIVELATEAEAKAKTDTHRAITPKTLDAVIEGHNNIVHRSGAETITGSKSFTSSPAIAMDNYPLLKLKNKGYKRGTSPNSDRTWGVVAVDTDDSYFADIIATVNSANNGGEKSLSLRIRGDDGAIIGTLGIISVNGNVYATAPTPANGDNSTKISTTAWVTTKLKEYLPLTGGKMISNNAIFRSVDDQYISIYGGSASGSGAQLDLCGKNHASLPSAFQLHARNGSVDKVLIGEIDGDLKWDSKHIVRSVNGVLANNAGNVSISISNIPNLQTELDGKALKNHTHDYLPLAGGTMRGNINMGTKSISDLNTIEFKPSSSTAGHGGFIDFHFNQSSEDYTSRIIESAEGVITVTSPNGFKCNGKNVVRSVNGNSADANGNITPQQTGCLPLIGGMMQGTISTTVGVANPAITFNNGTLGGQLWLFDVADTTYKGGFILRAKAPDGTFYDLGGRSDGALQWGGKYILNNSFLMNTDTSAIMLTAGTSSAGGAYFRLYGKGHSSGAGQFNVAATDGTNTTVLTGKPNGSLTWNGKDINLGNPRYDAGVSLGSKSSYTATERGWLMAMAVGGGSFITVTVNGAIVMSGGSATGEARSCFIPVKVGDTVAVYSGLALGQTGAAYPATMIFYPYMNA